MYVENNKFIYQDTMWLCIKRFKHSTTFIKNREQNHPAEICNEPIKYKKAQAERIVQFHA